MAPGLRTGSDATREQEWSFVEERRPKRVAKSRLLSQRQSQRVIGDNDQKTVSCHETGIKAERGGLATLPEFLDELLDRALLSLELFVLGLDSGGQLGDLCFECSDVGVCGGV